MKKKLLILALIVLLCFTGCTKRFTVEKENEPVKSYVSNILCKPTTKEMKKVYLENTDKLKVNYDKLVECKKFKVNSGGYEGLWTSGFVKPLAWGIIQLGKLVKNYGLAIMIAALILRTILFPFSKKSTMMNTNMKKAKPELDKLEKKYKGKDSQEEQTKKAQEMMLIYQKYKINPMSGCLLAFIQLPLLLAFYEAIQRTPAIFEDKFLFFELGRTPWNAIKGGEYAYIILVILIFVATLFSFRKTLKDQSANPAMNMKTTLYFMLAIITYSSFTIASAVGIYWVTSNVFTIVQNILV